MIKFRATKDQVKRMGAMAANAASPVGLGMIHSKLGGNFKPEDFDIDERLGMSLDYVQGRMIKLVVRPVKDEPEIWQSNAFPPRSNYQSWAGKYPDTKLITEVGAEIVD